MFKTPEEVVATILANPASSYAEIGKMFGLAQTTVCSIAKKFNVTRKRGSGSEAHPVQLGSKKAVR